MKNKVPDIFRLSQYEKEELKEKTRMINRIQVDNDIVPMQYSDVIHFLLSRSLELVKIDKKGRITIAGK